MKSLLSLCLFLPALACAHVLEGHYTLDLHFGNQRFIDQLVIEQVEYKHDAEDALCQECPSLELVRGHFISPDLFDVPLLLSSCVISQGQQQLLHFAFDLNEGNGQKRYAFEAVISYSAGANVRLEHGVISVAGQQIGYFFGSKIGEML